MRRMSVFRKRSRTAVFVAALVTAVPLGIAPAQAAAADGPSWERAALSQPEPERPSVVRLIVPDQAAFERLVAAGTDLTGHVLRSPDGTVEADAVVTPSQVTALRRLGVTTVRTTESPAQEKQARPTAAPRAEGAADQVTIDRAVWFKTAGQHFISVQARTSAGAPDGLTLTAEWAGARGTSGQAALSPFVDADTYMGHLTSTPAPADGRPQRITVTSSQGGTATAQVVEWPDGDRPPRSGRGYQKDFIDHYMPPAELYARINALHRRFPRLTEIINLPFKTNGYRRNAQAVLGTTPGAAVVVTAKAYGSEGGNDLLVEVVDPGRANSPLGVTVDGKLITVSLATDGAGVPASTAAQVAAALTARPDSPVTASTYRGNAGADVLAPTGGPVQLSDFLQAPAGVSRAPVQVQALRIGVHRDGSRTGVFAYAQEHAREWVTPLVTIEAAERLLRNYGSDPATTRLLRRTDIFILPSVNPDGANYSFYDFNSQRKNMRNHCPAAQGDPGLRNSWGVDINRNYAVGSLFDGYSGASTNCQSGTFAGPFEHSEPESGNVIWLAQRYRNIKFALNVHSFGGYFMWPPGAYVADGRVTLPRPTEQELDFFLDSAKTIEQGIAAERGTITWPQNTGPVTDVLYSAAGNSADELWYDLGIFGWDFEVGNSLWNAEARQWEDVGFQPPFDEGHQEAMEYASGLISLIGIAADYRNRDR
jgi:hypothetical protein